MISVIAEIDKLEERIKNIILSKLNESETLENKANVYCSVGCNSEGEDYMDLEFYKINKDDLLLEESRWGWIENKEDLLEEIYA